MSVDEDLIKQHLANHVNEFHKPSEPGLTRASIALMSPAEYAAKRSEILKAMKSGQIK